jgi:hypothetical protein
MTLYPIAVFVHVVGGFGLFTAMGLEWVLVARLGRIETTEQARDWLGLLGVIRRLSPASLAVLLLAGIYMMVTVWGGAGWVVVAFFALLSLPPLGMISGLRLPAIQREIAGESGPLAPALRQRLGDPLRRATSEVQAPSSAAGQPCSTPAPPTLLRVAGPGYRAVPGPRLPACSPFLTTTTAMPTTLPPRAWSAKAPPSST